ncbi:hypothetical protein CFIMG_008201RA00001 [Ceratocystis fimbriata CBS 114723]|uniref:Pentatricopeptide repeat protein n=1 Tax=Ceratocystis fimbriata CBS 114723 TaxID=1035309 RepID=A0A2C5X6C3_9PEZI|nr:hypothetical protein CFIMG_008201RA00001 [Ceratocystis fimbriata CBS 114723]
MKTPARLDGATTCTAAFRLVASAIATSSSGGLPTTHPIYLQPASPSSALSIPRPSARRLTQPKSQACCKSSQWLFSTFFTPSSSVLYMPVASRSLWSSRRVESPADGLQEAADETDIESKVDHRAYLEMRSGSSMELESRAAIKPAAESRLKSLMRVRKEPHSAEAAVGTLDLLAMIDDTPVGHVEEYLDFHQDTYLRRYANSDGPRLRASDRPDDYDYPSLEDSVGRSDHSLQIYTELLFAVRQRSRGNNRISLLSIFRIYQKLPEPRMLHISAAMRHRLLRTFGTPERYDSPAMLRYYSLVEDVKACGLALTHYEWNYSMAFAKRFIRDRDDSWISVALKIWREMEHESHIKANEVTFNMLFDAATKCGNFTLAKGIYSEMTARGIKFNRYHHVSLIHYFGLRQDGDGVRAAYKDMALAGEMIDDVVLNCVIAGFLNAGEEVAADYVYARMKKCSDGGLGPPPADYRARRVITRVLMMWAKLARRHPRLRSKMQANTNMAPDTRTYRILVQHYAVCVGDMSRVAAYLDDMRWFQVPMDGRIFVTLFEAFSRHGGTYSGADFSKKRLQSIFTALLNTLDANVQGVYVDTWMVMWALRAFMRCGDQRDVLGAYAQLKERWTLNKTKVLHLEQFMRRVVEHRDYVGQLDRLKGGASISQWTGVFPHGQDS